jgi:hypothetical protein
VTIATIQGFDATHENIGHLPKGQAAGYMTGSPSVQWTDADWSAHPGAVRIDQSPVITAIDVRCDMVDYEAGAVTLAELAQVVKDAQAAYVAGLRPGQRWPGVYCSRSNVTRAVNALLAGGVKSCPLGVADWNKNETTARLEVEQASGPFPIVWRQYANEGTYDAGVFSERWLSTVSAARTPAPPGQWLNAQQWTWVSAIQCGTGLDGQFHMFHLNGGTWEKVI